jgi:hypothetical protein
MLRKTIQKSPREGVTTEARLSECGRAICILSRLKGLPALAEQSDGPHFIRNYFIVLQNIV